MVIRMRSGVKKFTLCYSINGVETAEEMTFESRNHVRKVLGPVANTTHLISFNRFMDCQKRDQEKIMRRILRKIALILIIESTEKIDMSVDSIYCLS